MATMDINLTNACVIDGVRHEAGATVSNVTDTTQAALTAAHVEFTEHPA